MRRLTIGTTAVAITIAAASAGCAAPSRTVAGAGAAAQVVSGPSAALIPVRDGGFEFVILETARAQQVGDPTSPGLSVDARGVFIVISLSIRNAADHPLTFIDRDQTLVDDRGEQYAVSNAADIYGNRDIRSTTIGPGGALTVHIAFDVPDQTVPRALILRGSGTSAGVEVPLAG